MKRHIVNWIAGGCALAIMLPASAGLLLSVEPSSTTVGIGGLVTVDLRISGLTPPPGLAGYAIDLNYDAAYVAPLSVSYGTGLGSSVTFVDLTTNPLFVSEVSLETAQSFFDGQPGSFLLASLTFQGVALGTSPLAFAASTSLTDENGTSLVFNTVAGAIQVVPEPGQVAGTMAMLAVAGGFVFLRRQPRQG